MTLFQATAIVWLLGSVARVAMYATNAFGMADALGISLGGVLVGAAVGVAVAVALWVRADVRSAVIAVLFGFYVLPSLFFLPMTGLPGWILVLAVLGIAAFALSVFCVLRGRRAST